MKVLLIEDDEEKATKVSGFVSSEYKGAEIAVARSINSGLRALISGVGSLDVVLLDMTLPSFDVSPQEPSGGAPENFAGRELLAQMKLRGIEIPTIVVTQFDSFGEGDAKVSLNTLATELSSQYGAQFKGYVYYNSAQEGWRAALDKMIKENIGIGAS
ncbi:response regulator [Thiohalomonas denitrificans]|uniref:Response regulator receiver domain-containing protein n=1 Tax=Thiohalomonas denitrificans TaxID=415747 RepID=A0A1G5QCZ1_9GAMM|nr:response regulator [Thiohalomonas denitrificans]SCZ59370.1 hypothetical protein SAMN03097708_01850 [Thiohalomonas denitrificans]